jgi:hypothetical protein
LFDIARELEEQERKRTLIWKRKYTDSATTSSTERGTMILYLTRRNMTVSWKETGRVTEVASGSNAGCYIDYWGRANLYEEIDSRWKG